MPYAIKSIQVKYGDRTTSATVEYIASDYATAAAAAQAVGLVPGSTSSLIAHAWTGPNAIVQSVTVSSVEGGGGSVWNVTAEYGTQQGEDRFVGYSSDISGTYVDAWRGSFNIPSNGTASGSDMGGTGVDQAGEPVSQFIWQTALQITRRYNAGTAIPWGSIWSALGQRNSATFEGAAAGQLLFKGVKVTTIEKCRFEVTYDFMGDQWYHMRQVPEREGDGRVRLNSSKKADVVRLIQPFPNTTSFATLTGNYSICAD